jgi:beta-galactosidase
MRRHFIPFLFFLLILFLPVKGQTAKDFFPVHDLMPVGAYYYPEHWPSSEWERDIKKMADMGFEFTHIGEFGWAQMEPSDGKFDFTWIDKFLDICGKYNIKVIMCTPSPCPPVWLGLKYPEIYAMTGNYQRKEHGTRGNNSLSNEVYRNYVFRLIEHLAAKYGNDNRVWGWQLDNEPGAPEDYSPSAQERFRQWLIAKYGIIEKLNLAWGTTFWSQVYNKFEEISIPNVSVNPWGINPHAMLDYRRFLADIQADFLNSQYVILRKDISSRQWVTTNYIAAIGSADPRRSDKLDFLSYTMYPVGGGKNLDSLGFRIGWIDGIAFGCNFYRPVKGVTGVMELQPGQVNWGMINPQPMPGAIRMWLWHAFAGGCSFACTYRFRQPLFGSEQYHYGILRTDGVTPSPGGLEYSKVASEMKQLRKYYQSTDQEPSDYASRRTAILWNHENLWDIEQEKQTSQWSSWGHVFKYMEITKSLGAPLDFISENDNFSKYKVLIAPAYQLVDSSLVLKWKQYIKDGGNLILTCRTGQKDRNGHLWEASWAAPILDLIGSKISFFDLLPEDVIAKVSFKHKEYSWNNWADVLSPKQGTTVLATYSSEFYKDSAAVVTRKLGKGTVSYIGVDTDSGELEKELCHAIYEGAGIKTTFYPKGVYVDWRDGFWVAVNYSSHPFKLNVKQNTQFIIGDVQVNPADVAVWKE